MDVSCLVRDDAFSSQHNIVLLAAQIQTRLEMNGSGVGLYSGFKFKYEIYDISYEFKVDIPHLMM